MPPTPAPSRLSALLSGPGDLVPKVECHCRPTDPLLPKLLAELVDKRAAVSGRWESADLPLDNPNRPALHRPASTCAVQLANGMVGVLKIQQNGDCVLFVRLLRAQTNAWADNHKQPHSGARMFWRALQDHQVYPILAQAHPFVLKPNQVHHPYVLSILCLMSRERWMVKPASDSALLPTNKGSFTLVGLPPLPEHFEQCLLLLGCTEAFVDDEEGDAPLSARTAIKSVWGETPRPLIAQDAADMFAFAGEELSTHANPGIFTRVIPAINKHAPEAKAVKTAWAECWFETRLRTDDDESSSSEEVEAEAVAAAVAEAPAEAGGEGDGRPEATLASSDDEDAPLRREVEARAVAQASASAPPRPIARSKDAASSSASSSTTASVAPAQGAPRKQPQAKQPTRQPPKAKARAKGSKAKVVVLDDDDDSADDQADDKDGAGSVGRQDADLADVGESSEEEDDTSSSSSSSSSDSDAAPRRPAKRPRRAPSDDDDDEEESEDEEEEEDASTAPIAPAGDPEPAPAPPPSPQGTDLLIQMAKPCHEKLQRHLRSHAPFLLARHADQLKTDVGLLQSASSPVALLAAALSIINTLIDVQEDRARGASMLVHCNEMGRLTEMAAQTKEFAEAIRAFLDRAGPA